MRARWALACLALAACRSEHSVALSDHLQAEVKTPPSGMIQLLGPSTTVRYRGRPVMEGPGLHYIELGESVALRDDVHQRVIVVRADGQDREVRCEGGMALAPERFVGLDCWRGHTTADFAVVRYAASGALAHTYRVPAAASACGASRVGYLGYEEDGEPVIGYECMVGGTRVCRAASLGPREQALGELRASTPDVDCGYLLRTEGTRRYADVRNWTQIK